MVEVASNDGYLLQHAVAAGIPCLGIEPSVNVGAAARKRGVPTETAFLDEQLAAAVRAGHGPADLVVANNVYAHIPDLLGFTRSLRGLLADDGWLSIEVHHALNLVSLGQFDTIYHEHFQYYTVLSAMRALATAGLAVVDVELIPTHGGSIRVWARPKESAGPRSERVDDVLRVEEEAGLHQVDGYLQLRPRTEAVRHELLRFLLDRRAEGKRVVGYGAPGKGNTLLNYCGIRSDLLEYTVDRNPYKHGRFTPGTRIPIHDPAQIDKDRPEVVLALPWNLETELTEQLAYISEWGGQLSFRCPRCMPPPSRTSETTGGNNMKVVLFCGGYGMRMRDSAGDGMPKPMQMVGPRPLIWHVMRYYAHFGHKEFILCLGYGASHIKNYFLTYQEAASNDFAMRGGHIQLMHSDISDWSITFVDTGLESAIGERLRRVREHLGGGRVFPGQLRRCADRRAVGPRDRGIPRVRGRRFDDGRPAGVERFTVSRSVKQVR